jgi:SHS2 domain-containing protein
VDYEYFDHTADIGLKAHGETLAQMFENAAKGMFSIMLEVISDAEPTRTANVDLEQEEENTEQMFVDWLNELLYILETKDIVPSEFRVIQLDGKRLQAEISGNPFNKEIHRYKTEIKSATYHMLEIGRENDKYFGMILFDI